MTKKEVIISIKGIQNAENSDDNIEFITNGQYVFKDGCYYISYKESQMTGMNGTNTTVKVDGEHCVTITRGGKYKTQLILEKGERHLCPYNTDYGSMMMGVSTGDITSSLKSEGGSIYVKYTLEVNHALLSENSVEISVRENKADDKSNTIS